MPSPDQERQWRLSAWCGPGACKHAGLLFLSQWQMGLRRANSAIYCHSPASVGADRVLEQPSPLPNSKQVDLHSCPSLTCMELSPWNVKAAAVFTTGFLSQFGNLFHMSSNAPNPLCLDLRRQRWGKHYWGTKCKGHWSHQLVKNLDKEVEPTAFPSLARLRCTSDRSKLQRAGLVTRTWISSTGQLAGVRWHDDRGARSHRAL